MTARERQGILPHESALEKDVEVGNLGTGDGTSATSVTPPLTRDGEREGGQTEDAPATTTQENRNGVAEAAAESGSPEDGRSKAQTLVIVSALLAALFLSALDITIVTVAIPSISEQFHSTVGYTWIGSAYILACAASAPTWGKISDIWGRKPILLLAVGIFWVGSLISGVAVNMNMVIVGRTIQGIGSGGILILVNVCISDLFSMRNRGESPARASTATLGVAHIMVAPHSGSKGY